MKLSDVVLACGTKLVDVESQAPLFITEMDTNVRSVGTWWVESADRDGGAIWLIVAGNVRFYPGVLYSTEQSAWRAIAAQKQAELDAIRAKAGMGGGGKYVTDKAACDEGGRFMCAVRDSDSQCRVADGFSFISKQQAISRAEAIAAALNASGVDIE